MSDVTPEFDRPVAFLDIESTGVKTDRDRIVELCVIRIDTTGEVTERTRRLNPGVTIPPEATEVHGITNAMVRDEPTFLQVAGSLLELLEPCDLCGFNIRRFDLPMLRAEFGRVGKSLDVGDRRIIDLQQIFFSKEPRDLSAASRFYLGQDHEGAHGAEADTRLLIDLLRGQLERYPDLPRDAAGLHAFCDEFGPFETEVEAWFDTTATDKLRWRFRRGKYDTLTIAEVRRKNPGYLGWMLKELEDPDVLAVLREVMTTPSEEPAGAPDLFAGGSGYG